MDPTINQEMIDAINKIREAKRDLVRLVSQVRKTLRTPKYSEPTIDKHGRKVRRLIYNPERDPEYKYYYLALKYVPNPDDGIIY